MEKITQILTQLASEMPGFLACALVDKEEGLTIAEQKSEQDFEVSITAAYSVELLRAQKRALESINEQDESIEIFAFTKNYLFISKSVGDTPFYLHLVLKREKAVLGLVFAFLRRYVLLLEKAIEEWQKA